MNQTQSKEAQNPARFWDKLAPKYSRQPLADPAAFERKVAITQAHMTSSDVVLDVGCGTGSFALIVAPFAQHVHGVDFSREMIGIARGKAHASNVQNVSFHVGELGPALPFQAASLNGICAYSVLHLLEDPLAVLEHIHRLLVPGGFFIASTACLAESWVPFAPILRVMRLFGKAPYVNILSKADVCGYLGRAGFVDISCPDVGAKKEVLFTVARKAGAARLPDVGNP